MRSIMNRIVLLVALVALAPPCKVWAYGAAHVGYTHVGPNGVQHYGETVARGPGGTYEGSHGTAVNSSGGAYHTETRGATTPSGAYGVQTSTGTTSGYHYAPSYSGAAYGHSASYTYVR